MYKLSIKGTAASEKIFRKPSHVRIYIYDEFDALTQSGNCVFEIDTSVTEKENNIIEAEWNTEVDLINSKLPTAEFSFKFLDVDKKYNPETNDGAWQKIEKQLPCCFYFGYTLEDDSIEWVKCGTYITTGENEWDVSGYIPIITIYVKSIVYFLTDEIDISTINTATYYDMISSGLEKIKENNEFLEKEWVKVIIPEEFKNYSILRAFEEESNYVVNELFQLTAQASRRFLCVDRNGNIVFSPISTELKDFYLNYEKTNTPPSLTRYPFLKKFSLTGHTSVHDEEWSNTNVTNLDSGNEANTLHFQVSTSNPTQTYRIKTPPFFELKFHFVRYNDFNQDIGSDLALFAQNEYGTKTYANVWWFSRIENNIFEITFDSINSSPNYYADISILSKKWIEKNIENIKVFSIDTIGENCSIDNPFVTNEDDVERVSSYLVDNLKMRNEYKGAENRGYPELDVGDMITAETAYSSSMPVYLLSNKVKYDGTLSGECKYLLLQK